MNTEFFIIFFILIFFLTVKKLFLYLWQIKNFQKEYFYLVNVSLLQIVQIFGYFLNFRFLLDSNILVNTIFIFLSLSASCPIIRYLEKTKNNYLLIYKKSIKYTLVFFIFSVFITFLLFLASKSFIFIKISYLLNFVYSFYRIILDIFLFAKTKNLNYIVFLKNWMFLIFLISLTELGNLLFNYSKLWNSLVILPITIIFVFIKYRAIKHKSIY